LIHVSSIEAITCALGGQIAWLFTQTNQAGR
jgi:hypothetical protein